MGFKRTQELAEKAENLFNNISHLSDAEINNENIHGKIIDDVSSLSEGITDEMQALMLDPANNERKLASIRSILTTIENIHLQTKQSILIYVNNCLGVLQLMKSSEGIPYECFSLLCDKQKKILDILSKHPMSIVTHEEMHVALYGEPMPLNTGRDPRAKIITLVSRINKIIEGFGMINAIHGKGFMWEPK